MTKTSWTERWHITPGQPTGGGIKLVTCLIAGSESRASAPMRVLSVGTARQHNTCAHRIQQICLYTRTQTTHVVAHCNQHLPGYCKICHAIEVQSPLATTCRRFVLQNWLQVAQRIDNKFRESQKPATKEQRKCRTVCSPTSPQQSEIVELRLALAGLSHQRTYPENPVSLLGKSNKIPTTNNPCLVPLITKYILTIKFKTRTLPEGGGHCDQFSFSYAFLLLT